MIPMNNNPIMQIGALLASGKSPSQIVGILAQQNPDAQRAMSIMRGKSPQQLEQIARNMARERGTTVEDVARSLGVGFPSNR